MQISKTSNFLRVKKKKYNNFVLEYEEMNNLRFLLLIGLCFKEYDYEKYYIFFDCDELVQKYCYLFALFCNLKIIFTTFQF